MTNVPSYNTTGISRSDIKITVKEAVHYKVWNPVTATIYAEGNITDDAAVDTIAQKNGIDAPITGTFSAGQFQILLSDKAGNSLNYFTNTDTWNVNDQTISLKKDASYTTPDVTKSSIITFALEADMQLDLTSVIPVNQNVINSNVAINDIDMTSPSAQQVNIQISDLLHLGITNAFDTTTSAYKDDVQMRIRGDSSDSVVLEKDIWSAPNTSTPFILDGHNYTVYTSKDGLHDLLIEQTITNVTF